MADKFNVIRYIGDQWEYALQGVEPSKAVLKAKEITESPGALLGSITKVMITDSGDYCVFEWQHGKGVVYPPRVK